MAMDAIPVDRLRDSLDKLMLRFQAANDPGSPSKAWMIHVHDRGDEKPAIYATADGYDAPSVKSSPSTWSYDGVPAIVPAIGPVVGPPKSSAIQRCVRLKGYQHLEPICKDAARLLDGLPTSVQKRLWSDLPARHQLLGDGMKRWVLAVFELGSANVVWSPLRCERRYPITGEQAKTIFAPESKLPADADWYATLPDFAAASVQAIAILQSWLADGTDAGEPIKVESAAESVWRSYFNLPDDVCDLMARLMDNWPELRQSLTQAEQATVRAVCRLLPEQPPKHTVAGVPDLFATRQFLEAVLAFNEAMPTRKASGRGGKRTAKQRSKPTNGKAGRPPIKGTKEEQKLQLYNEWQTAKDGGITMKDFCADADNRKRGITEKQINNAVDFVYRRRKRGQL